MPKQVINVMGKFEGGTVEFPCWHEGDPYFPSVTAAEEFIQSRKESQVIRECKYRISLADMPFTYEEAEALYDNAADAYELYLGEE